MEHSKEYYQSFVTFLQTACDKEERSFSYEEGCKIAGDYWMAICDYLKERRLANVNYGDMYIHDFPPLAPIIADCEAMVDAIEKAEHDRWLDNSGKWIAIICGVGGFIVSLVALVLSIIAFQK